MQIENDPAQQHFYYLPNAGWDSVCRITLEDTLLNSSSPGQNGRHFADDIFKGIFLNEKVRFVAKIWMKFITMGPIDNNPALD